MTPRLVFLHGLESGPHGSKYQALREIDPDLISPDCEGLNDIGERLAVIERELEGIGRMVLVGSSFGGLAALLFAQLPENRGRGHARQCQGVGGDGWHAVLQVVVMSTVAENGADGPRIPPAPAGGELLRLFRHGARFDVPARAGCRKRR